MNSMHSLDEATEARRLRFLLEEGLELLATFQIISSAEKRRAIMESVREAAASEGARLPTVENIEQPNAVSGPASYPCHELSN